MFINGQRQAACKRSEDACSNTINLQFEKITKPPFEKSIRSSLALPTDIGALQFRKLVLCALFHRTLSTINPTALLCQIQLQRKIQVIRCNRSIFGLTPRSTGPDSILRSLACGGRRGGRTSTLLLLVFYRNIIFPRARSSRRARTPPAPTGSPSGGSGISSVASPCRPTSIAGASGRSSAMACSRSCCRSGPTPPRSRPR